MGALAGSVAVVTGASSGIGAAVAEVLAADGAAVVLVARRKERLQEVADRIRSAGGDADVVPTDVTRRTEVEAMVAGTVERRGRVDILVNNAGVMPLAPLADARVDQWERMIDVNLKGVLYGLGAVLPVMVRQGSGHVVNIGSVAGRRPFPGGSVYAATKFAMRALSWGMHLELGAEHGIRVTDIQPGVVATELFDHIEDDAIRAGFQQGWEGRRPLQPEDVARAVHHAVTSPDHVSVSEILIRPTDQPT
ncbi:MAG: SDR family oxidoreductase [Longimicrobiales bacterium]